MLIPKKSERLKKLERKAPKRLDAEACLDRFAAFMAGEKLFEITVPIESPDGIFDIKVVYEPITAYQLAQIYDGTDRSDVPLTVDEQFELLAEELSLSCRNWRFVNVPRGKADYKNHEISVQDLTVEARRMLEMELVPGVGKSPQAIGQAAKGSRRMVGKENRGDAAPASQPTA